MCAELHRMSQAPGRLGSVRPFRSRCRAGAGLCRAQVNRAHQAGPGVRQAAGPDTEWAEQRERQPVKWWSHAETVTPVSPTRPHQHPDTNKKNLGILTLDWVNLSSRPQEVRLDRAGCPCECVARLVSCACLVCLLVSARVWAPHQVLVPTVCLCVPGEGGLGRQRSCSELSECKYRNVQCVVQPASGPVGH